MFKVQSFNTETLARVTVREGITTRTEARRIMCALQAAETNEKIAYCVAGR
jgi:hypothetical protein